MIGFPKVFSTKKDFYNAVKLYPVETKEKLKQLMANRFIWVKTKVLKEDEIGIEDDTHKVVELQHEDVNSPTGFTVDRVQMKLIVDPNSEFNRLGWTLDEANIFLVD